MASFGLDAMTNLALDAARCLLMAKVAARTYPRAHCIFWQNLPDSVPNRAAHLPALTETVRHETSLMVLNRLSSHMLPTVLSPETVGWRPELVAVWEKQLKAARTEMDRMERIGEDWAWTYGYVYSLRGLTQVDRCGLPSGETYPSRLPTLMNEACYLQKKIAARPSLDSLAQFECLAALADWQPAPNVTTDTTVLNEWRDFWLELYQNQKGCMDNPCHEPDRLVIIKGIAAKALLNLTEARAKEETGVPTELETLLLESLRTAVDVAGATGRNGYDLDWLNWQPQDRTRFPADKLAELAETRLRRFRLSCQDYKAQRVLYTALKELVRWDRTGLLADCRIDLWPRVVSDVGGYIDACLRMQVPIIDDLNHELCRWLVRDEVTQVEGGRELLRKLENHWQSGCNMGRSSRLIAWEGRLALHRAGLQTEATSVFHEDLLEAIKTEKVGEIRLVLSTWRPEKDTPDRMLKEWEDWWQEGLKSENEQISRTSALALLRPDPADDIVPRQGRLRDVLHALPEHLRPKLSIAEVTHLMKATGGLPSGSPNANPNRTWRFSSNEANVRAPMEWAVPVSAPTTVPTDRQDWPPQRTTGSRR